MNWQSGEKLAYVDRTLCSGNLVLQKKPMLAPDDEKILGMFG